MALLCVMALCVGRPRRAGDRQRGTFRLLQRDYCVDGLEAAKYPVLQEEIWAANVRQRLKQAANQNAALKAVC